MQENLHLDRREIRDREAGGRREEDIQTTTQDLPADRAGDMAIRAAQGPAVVIGEKLTVFIPSLPRVREQ
jgi:hypothetical protein